MYFQKATGRRPFGFADYRVTDRYAAPCQQVEKPFDFGQGFVEGRHMNMPAKTLKFNFIFYIV